LLKFYSKAKFTAHNPMPNAIGVWTIDRPGVLGLRGIWGVNARFVYTVRSSKVPVGCIVKLLKSRDGKISPYLIRESITRARQPRREATQQIEGSESHA